MKKISTLAVLTVLTLAPFTAEAYGYYQYRSYAPMIQYQSGFYNAPYNMITYMYYAPEVRYPSYTSWPSYTSSYVPYTGSYAGGVMVIR